MTVTAAALGGVPTAEITIDGIEPRHVVLYFHSGVYVLGDAFQAAGLASQVGRRARAKVISVDYRLAPEHPYPAAVDDALAAYEALLQGGTAPSLRWTEPDSSCRRISRLQNASLHSERRNARDDGLKSESRPAPRIRRSRHPTSRSPLTP